MGKHESVTECRYVSTGMYTHNVKLPLLLYRIIYAC